MDNIQNIIFNMKLYYLTNKLTDKYEINATVVVIQSLAPRVGNESAKRR